MASPRSVVAALAATVSLSFVLLAVPRAAFAAGEDCPPGSVWKTNEGYGWCEPTVCQNDGQCESSEVCRPIPLCLLVGKEDADAGLLGKAKQRLEATAACAADRTCPQNSVCSVLSRCVSKIKADKMGLLATPTPALSASAATAATDVPAKKSACGCRVVGAPAPGSAGALALAIFAFAALSRRRARARRRAP